MWIYYCGLYCRVNFNVLIVIYNIKIGNGNLNNVILFGLFKNIVIIFIFKKK